MRGRLSGFHLALLIIVLVFASADAAPTETPTLEHVRSLINAAQFAEAEAEAQRLLEDVSSREGDASLAAAQAMDLVVDAQNKGGKTDSTHTLAMARKAVSIKERVSGHDAAEVAASLELLGDTLRTLERYSEAERTLERALHIRERANPPNLIAVATCLVRLANLKSVAGDYAGSRELFERLIPILEKEKGVSGGTLAGALYNQGRCLYRLGDLNEAKASYERARAIVLKEFGPDYLLDGYVSNSLGNLLSETGEFDLARSEYENAIRIGVLSHRDDFVSSCLANMGSLYRDLGDNAAAETSFAKALEVETRSYGARSSEAARTTYSLGRLYYQDGDYQRALAFAETSLDIRREVLGPDHTEVADSMLLLGLCRLETGQPQSAAPQFEKAEAIYKERLGATHWDVSEALYGLAKATDRMGNTAKARALYEQSLQLKEMVVGPDHPSLGEISSDLATLLGRTGHEREAFALALHSARMVGQHVRAMIASFPERQALSYAAISKRGLDVAISSLRRKPGADATSKCWDALIHARALVTDEMARRNRSLTDVQDSEVARLEGERSTANRKLANLLVRGPESEPDEYRTHLDAARRGVEEVERRLAEKSRDFREQQAGSLIGFDAVSGALSKGDALVALVLYKDALQSKEATPSYLAFVKRGQSAPETVFFGPAAPVDTLVARMRREMASPTSEAAYRRMALELRKIIWDPLPVRGAERVFWIADGSISFVNVYALPVEGEGRYLVDQGPLIVNLVAERDLVSLATQAKLGTGLLAIGGADFEKSEQTSDRAQASVSVTTMSPRRFRGTEAGCESFRNIRFEPLPETIEEAKTIAGLWDRARGSSEKNALLLVGSGASEASFKAKAPGRRTLHVATHGFFLGENCPGAGLGTRGISGHSPKKSSASESLGQPLYLSGLVLAGANHREDAGPDDEDGVLTAEEIAALDLHGVEWGVLSACESGVGNVEAREGIRGLRCAFQAAGVRTLIMSLWSVDDEATREWMTALYDCHLVRKLGTGTSLREASRQILATRRSRNVTTHPFFWAGFVGTGDWR